MMGGEAGGAAVEVVVAVQRPRRAAALQAATALAAQAKTEGDLSGPEEASGSEHEVAESSGNDSDE
jgi:hypothetical protein